MKKSIFVKTAVLALVAGSLLIFVSAGKTKSADLKSAQTLVEDMPTIQAFLDDFEKLFGKSVKND